MIAGKYYEPGDKVRTTFANRLGVVEEVRISKYMTYYLVEMADDGVIVSYPHERLERVMVKGEAITCPNCNQEFGR